MRPRCLFLFTLLACGLVQAVNAFDIPRGAWQRYIGDIPDDPATIDANRGVVLGGFGAGAFMYNMSGCFGPWADKVGNYAHGCYKEAAFHVYEKKGEQKTVRCLSTDSLLMPEWEKLQVGEGIYHALQPKGWCVYYCFESDVSMEFFSPIIAHNYRETSYPVAVFRFELFNPTAESVQVAVMFTWPNPPFDQGRYTRTGFSNTLVETNDVTAIVLKAVHPDNGVETQNSEWCIAARQAEEVAITYAGWDRSGDGSDIWGQFSDDGMLSNQVNALDSAAAIAVKTVLPPGVSRVIPLALSWDFPVVEFKNRYAQGHSTQWWKMYCEYFDTLSDNSFDIAAEALENHQHWEDQVDAWMSPFIDDLRYPDWLICAAFNELYYDQFGGSFWESGLRSGHPEEFMGLHPDDHKNFIMESQAYTLSGNINVGHYSSIVYAEFWPQMERDLLRCHADFVLYYDGCDPSVPHQTSPEIGAPRDVSGEDSCMIADPFFVMSPHGYPRRAPPCASGEVHVLTDNSSKFIQRCWRYYALYQDMDFLQYVWPAVESTYHFMKTYDCEFPPADSLPDAKGYDNTYDGWSMWGTDAYSGGLWIGALESMDTMAAILNQPVRDEVEIWLEAARRNLDAQLWDSTGEYYRIDTESEYPTAIFTDALCGQRYCEAYGLPDILPRWKINQHLEKVYEVCVAPNLNFGAKLGRLPDGSTVHNGDPYTDEYWVGTTYFTAASMYHAGLRDEALNTAYGAYYPVYEADHLAYWFNTPEAWIDGGYVPRPKPKRRPEDPLLQEFKSEPVSPDSTLIFVHQYQRARAVWELMFEIQNHSTYYQCGDVNGDGVIEIGDVLFLINYLYRNGNPPDPLAAGDVNLNGIVDLEDVIYLLNYLFKEGSAPCAA